MSSYTPNLQLFKYNTSTDGKEVFSIEQALNHNWDILDQNSGSRNIGEIVASTIPLTDAGLHPLDGSLLQYGSYKAFINYIAGLVSSYPDLFVSETDWQDSITQYGVCGKFVYDSVNNTVRLPKYSNKIYTQDISSSAPVVGNGLTLGLTNGTKNWGMTVYSGLGYDGITSAYGKNIGTSTGTVDTDNNKSVGVTTNPTKSGLVADIANITTSLEGYYYIVVATSTKTNIQVDIDEIATDLNGKADVDLSNCTKPHIVQASDVSILPRWWVVYSNGKCIEGGVTSNVAPQTESGFEVSFIKEFTSVDNLLLSSEYVSGSNSGDNTVLTFQNLGTTGFEVLNFDGICTYKGHWQVTGNIS